MISSRLDCRVARAGREERLRLTLVASADADVLRLRGLKQLRQARALRLAAEASSQGAPLGHQELAALLFTSVSTLKRDLREMETQGVDVPLRIRRRRGNGGADE